MKDQSSIISSKIGRAGKLLQTGAKIGFNYLQHSIGSKNEDQNQKLDEKNADVIFEAFSSLKGGALKVVQMLSMDQTLLPEAYAKKFILSQYAAPPLSTPLVYKTLKTEWGKLPEQIFDDFMPRAVRAASMGQVHRATLHGKQVAVKIQYPGISESIASDLGLLRPIATQISGLKSSEIEVYFQEVTTKLKEETDYRLEMNNALKMMHLVTGLEGIIIGNYYQDLCTSKVLVMEWMNGMHLDEFMKTDPDQETRNLIGQRIWDFFAIQIHRFRFLHADPNPGNFLFDANGNITVLDFGCMKEVTDEMYNHFIQLINPNIYQDKEAFFALLQEIDLILPSDTEEDKQFFEKILTHSARLLGRPLFTDQFDFSDDSYLKEIGDFAMNNGREMSKRARGTPRGPKDALYINRTFFGIYTLLNQLGATVNCRKEWLFTMSPSKV